MERNVSLVDRLAELVGCEYVNHLCHLRYLNKQQRSKLLREVEKIPASDHNLFSWNNALEYLLGESKESSSERAREKLLAGLAQRI